MSPATSRRRRRSRFDQARSPGSPRRSRADAIRKTPAWPALARRARPAFGRQALIVNLPDRPAGCRDGSRVDQARAAGTRSRARSAGRRRSRVTGRREPAQRQRRCLDVFASLVRDRAHRCSRCRSRTSAHCSAVDRVPSGRTTSSGSRWRWSALARWRWALNRLVDARIDAREPAHRRASCRRESSLAFR